MVVTRHAAWAKHARHLTTQAKADAVEYLHDEVGHNYRLVNILAALGVAQLERLPEFIRRKREIARRYEAALRGMEGLTLMPEAPWAWSTFWLYTVLLNPNVFSVSKEDVIQSMGRCGVQVRPIWHPIHRQPVYHHAQAYRIEVADDLHRRGVSLPCSGSLSEEAQDKVVRELRRLAERAT
jgi:perosamine synthetase